MAQGTVIISDGQDWWSRTSGGGTVPSLGIPEAVAGVLGMQPVGSGLWMALEVEGPDLVWPEGLRPSLERLPDQPAVSWGVGVPYNLWLGSGPSPQWKHSSRIGS